MYKLTEHPAAKARTLMYLNVNSNNLKGPELFRIKGTLKYNLNVGREIREIIKKLGTREGGRVVKNLDVYLEVRDVFGTLLAQKVLPDVSVAFHNRQVKSDEWDCQPDFFPCDAMRQHDRLLYDTHCLHISEVDDTQVAFTPDLKALVADKQIRMRPGKYLTKFWGSGSQRPLLSDGEVKEIAERFAARNTPIQLLLVSNKDPDGWEWVYENSPASCMRYNRESRYLNEELYGRDHPVRAYAHPDNDLALAYIMCKGQRAPRDYYSNSEEDEFVVAARTIVNTSDKTYLRIYCDGDNSVLRIMENALENAGYSESSATLRGQRLVRRVFDEGYIICPYLDGGYTSVQDGGDYLEVSSSGYDGQNSNGLIRGAVCNCCGAAVASGEELTHVVDQDGPICASCLDDYTYAWVSRRSRSWVPDSCDIYNFNGESYTTEALDSHGLSICDECGEVEDDDNMVEAEDQWVCEHHTVECEVSGDTILERNSTYSDYDGVISDGHRVRLYPRGDYGHEYRVYSLTTSMGVTYVHKEFIQYATADELRLHFVVIGTQLLPVYCGVGRPPSRGDTYTNVTSGDDCEESIEAYMDSALEEELEAA